VEVIEDDGEEEPREIVIDDQPAESISKLHEKDEFSIDDPDVVEIDPFSQPSRNSFKSRRTSLHRGKQQSLLSKVAEDRLL
jgi:hypothetical protein